MTLGIKSTIYSENVMQHISLESIPILVITWNVNGHVETNVQALRDQLLFPRAKNPYNLQYVEEPDLTLDPQMVIIGFQELIELSTTNVIGNAVNVGQDTIDKLNQWEEALTTCLVEINDEFELIQRHHMVGLGLLVFTWRGLKKLIQNVQIAELPRGVGGVLGNKGAIYLRFEIYDTSICIINSHFAAHRDKLKKRNQDYYAIINYPAFPDLALLKSRQLLQSHIDSIKAVQVKGLLKSVRKRLQNYQQVYGIYCDGEVLPAIEGRVGSTVRSSYGSSLAPSHSNSQSHNNSRRHSRITSYSSNKSSTSYLMVEDSEESDDDSTTRATASMNTTTSNTPGNNSRATSTQRVTSLATASSLTASGSSASLNLTQLGYSNKHLTADDHDIILWLGDLNYRIVSSIDINTVYEMIQNNDCMTLLTYDQLNQEKEKNNIFQGFNEGLLTFPPTYQYIPGKDIYDNRKESKKRCPAWCDRILWRIGKHHTQQMILQELMSRERERIAKHTAKGGIALAGTVVPAVVSPNRKASITTIPSSKSMSTEEKSVEERIASSQSFKPFPETEGTLAQSGSKASSDSEVSSLASDDEQSETGLTGSADPIQKQRKREKAIMTLQSSSIDDMIANSTTDAVSRSIDSTVSDMKPARTDVSQIIITEGADGEEEDEEEEEENEGLGGGTIAEEEGEGLDDSDDEEDEDEEEERGGSTSDNEGEEGAASPHHHRQRRRLSVKELNQIKQIAEQLLKKTNTSRGSLTYTRSNSTASNNPLHSRSSMTHSPFSSKRTTTMDVHYLTSTNTNLDDLEGEESHDPSTMSPPRVQSVKGLFAEIDTQTITTSETETVTERFNESEKVMTTHPTLPSPSMKLQKIHTMIDDLLLTKQGSTENKNTTDEQEENTTQKAKDEDDEEEEDANESQYYLLREIVELMSYDRCPHNLSDHKPVRAFFNVKVKRINWKENEKTLVQNYSPYLKDIPNSYEPANNIVHHLYQLHHLPQRRKSTISMISDLGHPSTASSSSMSEQMLPRIIFTSQQWILSNPSIVALKSISRQGDICTIDLMNRSERFSARLSFVKETIPDWLLVSNANHSRLDAVIPPGAKVPYNFENDHTKATLALVDLVDEYRPYSVEKLPKLSKHLLLPSNNSKMEVYAIVSILVQWFAAPTPGSKSPPVASPTASHKDSSTSTNRSGASTEPTIIYEEYLHVPVLCSLSI